MLTLDCYDHFGSKISWASFHPSWAMKIPFRSHMRKLLSQVACMGLMFSDIGQEKALQTLRKLQLLCSSLYWWATFKFMGGDIHCVASVSLTPEKGLWEALGGRGRYFKEKYWCLHRLASWPSHRPLASLAWGNQAFNFLLSFPGSQPGLKYKVSDSTAREQAGSAACALVGLYEHGWTFKLLSLQLEFLSMEVRHGRVVRLPAGLEAAWFSLVQGNQTFFLHSFPFWYRSHDIAAWFEYETLIIPKFSYRRQNHHCPLHSKNRAFHLAASWTAFVPMIMVASALGSSDHLYLQILLYYSADAVYFFYF